MKNKALFITFEGGEGAGKSTQAKRLSDFFESLGKDALIIREPGGTKISEQIREILLNPQNAEMTKTAEALLYAASRAQLTEEVIKPALDAGRTVICDRFLDSSLVYQGYSGKLGTQLVMDINSAAVSGIVPDLTFFLDVSPELGLNRKISHTLDRIELLGLEYHKEIYSAYKDLCRLYPDRIRVIDGARPDGEVFSDIVTIIKQLL